jgi:hypothetical protein
MTETGVDTRSPMEDFSSTTTFVPESTDTSTFIPTEEPTAPISTQV